MRADYFNKRGVTVEIKPLAQIERSIQKNYRKYIWSPFIKAIKDYKLIEEGDVIAVAISGGKDSLLMAKLFQMLHRHTEINFTPIFISMDPGFNEVNKNNLIANCKHLDLPVHFYDSDIFEVAGRISGDYPCYMCARMRRGFLYARAKELGCNKLALGHHFDDVIETTMLNVLYAGNFKTMLPKLHSSNFEGLELIRPLYYIREESIKSFTTSNGIPAMNCGCSVAAGETSSKRREIKELIATLKKTNPLVDKSIFKAAENVNVDVVLGYQMNNQKYSFLDFYDDEKIIVDYVGELIKENLDVNAKIYKYTKLEEFKGDCKKGILQKINAIYIDIKIDLLNGIEIAKKIQQENPKIKIIYMTAYSQYSEAIFKTKPTYLLLKPIKKEQIKNP